MRNLLEFILYHQPKFQVWKKKKEYTVDTYIILECIIIIVIKICYSVCVYQPL